ncbi:MAG TPA: hypothetical protein VK184_09975 [Nostocaceae cyanobacterium]|nr:hypothetical protein [Nostocaceae cyanobacterium]
MNKRFLAVDKILAVILAGSGLFIAQPSLAQTNNTGFGTLESDRQNGLLSSPNSDFDVFDIMHRASQGSNQLDTQAANEKLDEATAAFRAKQQQLLQTPQPQNPVIPTGENQTPSNQ